MTSSRMPPIKPPAPCKAVKKTSPPNIEARKTGFMKNVPIITPATTVETTDATRRCPHLLLLFLVAPDYFLFRAYEYSFIPILENFFNITA